MVNHANLKGKIKKIKKSNQKSTKRAQAKG
jgi:hypothetical protein